MFNKNKSSRQGFGLIEILIAIFIVSLAFGSIALTNIVSLRLVSRQENQLQAAFLAQETLEAVRAVKEESWAIIEGLNAGQPYHPVPSGVPLKWILAPGGETLTGFTRQVTAGSVSRDNNDDIIEAGGTVDPGTKKITAAVSWTFEGKNYETLLTDYLTDWE